jgi:hypothetical protein
MSDNGNNLPATTGDRRPWEKLPRESFKAFQGFAVFRDMGPSRSLAKVASALGKSKALVEGWSAKHGWVERAEAYDVYVDARWREEREGELGEMRRREGALGALMQTLVFQRLRGHGTPGEEDYVPAMGAGELDVYGAAKLAESSVKLIRLSRGQPTELVKGALLVSGVELQRIAGDIIDIALKYIPEERESLFMTEVHAYAQGDRG